MVKKLISQIVKNNKQSDMEELSEIFEDVMMKLKDYDKKCYEKYKIKLMGMAYNYKFDSEMAHKIVENMKPKGEYWDMETTSQVRKQYGVNSDDNDFYIVMNSLVNDYGEIISPEDVDTYVKMAHAFINDHDAKDNKVWTYFTKIPKED